MAELWQPHPVTRDHDPALAGNLWLTFIDGFPEHDPTPLSGKAKVERRIARQALQATADPRMAQTAIFQPRFERLYTGNFQRHDPVEATWGQEILPFFKYFDAARRNENTSLHREAIYGSYLRILGDIRAQHARARSLRANSETMGEIRGRATELIAGALVARLRHPNITLVPSLALQDNFGISQDNHDYLYIDTYGKEPIVQPTQIKTRIKSEPDPQQYFDTIAMIYGDVDLHICNYVTNRCKRSNAHDCMINKTVDYIVSEDTPQKSAILDTLTANVLLKLSTWGERKDEWLHALEDHRRSQFGRIKQQ